jgi:hypothetical protein
MRLEFSVPKPTRRRLIGTGVFCSAFTGLFLAPGALGWPGAEMLSPKMVALTVVGCFGVGAWSLAWAERRVHVDSVPLLDDRPQRVFESQTGADAEQIPAVTR